jgi:hypothetical protein
LLDRLDELRTLLPALGEELAIARRQANRPQAENASVRRRVSALDGHHAPDRPRRSTRSSIFS